MAVFVFDVYYSVLAIKHRAVVGGAYYCSVSFCINLYLNTVRSKNNSTLESIQQIYEFKSKKKTNKQTKPKKKKINK